LTIKTGTTEELIHSVLKYELDGAFVSSPGEHVELESKEVGAEELVLLRFPNHCGHLTPNRYVFHNFSLSLAFVK